MKNLKIHHTHCQLHGNPGRRKGRNHAIISTHNADNKKVIWITSDQSIAIVNNGTGLFMAAPAL